MPFRLLFAENGYVHVCGHRGNSMNAPENTLPALESARRQGASTCEIDIVLSRDGEIVLCHDEVLDRTTDGKGKVGDHDLAALKMLDAGAWFAPEFAGTRIPTLAETIAAARALGLGLVVEIKERRRVQEMIARLGEVLDATQALEDVVLLSFDHPSLLLAGIGIRCHLPPPDWLACHEAYGCDPTAELAFALKSGAITSISGDDVSFLREFLVARGLPVPPV